MFHLILEHLTHNDLPAPWTKQLPTGYTFSVVVITEKPHQKQLNTNKISKDTPLFGIWRDLDNQEVNAYVRELRRNRFETR
jgi:hypothetical protein